MAKNRTDSQEELGRPSSTKSRTISFDNFEITLDDDVDDTEKNTDFTRRISIVEERLLEVLKGKELLSQELDGQEQNDLLSQQNIISKMSREEQKLVLSQQPHAFPCKDSYSKLPSDPTIWPQRPLLVRPTPYSSTRIIGIRRTRSHKYEELNGLCAGCMLPINNGREVQGECLVVDFESTHFKGTMLLRIKQAPEHGNNNQYTEQSYFDGKKRKFQTVIKGRFKNPLPMSQCVTGQAFDRPAGKLPAWFIVKAFIKFITTLAPQLEVVLDGEKPRFLTPLAATAHSVLVDSSPVEVDCLRKGIEDYHIEEPSSMDKTSVLSYIPDHVVEIPDTSKLSVPGRMKARKKVVNALAAKESLEPCFDTNKEYTFEFYQHLLDFGEELAVDMGRVAGKVGLAPATDGQPLKILGAYRNAETQELDTLWSFDIWHESLYPLAEKAQNSE